MEKEGIAKKAMHSAKPGDCEIDSVERYFCKILSISASVFGEDSAKKLSDIYFFTA